MGYIGAGPTRFNTADELTVTGDAEFNGNLTVKGTTTTIDSASVQTIDLGDNDKIRLGDSDDLQIYHDGTKSVIADEGVGDLWIKSNGANAGFVDGVNTRWSIKSIPSGAAELYYTATGQDIKLATTATGVNVTGSVAADYFKPASNQTDPNDGSAYIYQQSGIGWDFAALNLKFSTGASGNRAERMRIDSSGNLLVGKAASNVAVAGAEIRPSGFTGLTVDGGAGLTIRRLTSDGELQSFFKDTTKVGSIAATTRGGATDIFIGSGDTGIYFTQALDAIAPSNQGSDRDAAIDLGRSANRFKDLYLSGTVTANGLSTSGNIGVGNNNIFSVGKLSIGTSGISTAIDIVGNDISSQTIKMGANSNNPVQFNMFNGYGARQGITFNNNGSTGYTSFGMISENTALTFKTAAYNMGHTSDLSTGWTERMRIDSAGRVTMPYQPAFRAINAPVTSTNSVLYWANAPLNVGGHFNTSNGRFTAPVSGNYLFTMSMLFPTNNTNYARILFAVNGVSSTLYADTLTSAGASYLTLSSSAVIGLSAGDYVTVVNDGLIATYGAGYGSFCGHLIG